ncbi:ABC transporter ATP-binding protein [Anopheles sinensis]|uniref:ABC transporter ATP-binding protein n=1 Tax=Anopheles sinensis TaxID=74873 RepID=A0A084VXG5_ANOSI|nr:ABC transporter ATP-binding protein [Anopheles sinensis]
METSFVQDTPDPPVGRSLLSPGLAGMQPYGNRSLARETVPEKDQRPAETLSQSVNPDGV